MQAGARGEGGPYVWYADPGGCDHRDRAIVITRIGDRDRSEGAPENTPRLRHTFASPLLQQGASPAYVQRQLGHASIQLTVDTYGKWLPMGDKPTIDGLDDTAPEQAQRAFAGAPLVDSDPSGSNHWVRTGPGHARC
jgi:hypothetical protein